MLERWVRLFVSSVQDNRVEIKIQTSDRMRHFLQSDLFFAEYPPSVEDVPEAILAVPAVANIAPVCWATDADLYIDTLDCTFCNSLHEIQGTLSNFYPILDTSGEIVVNETVDCSAPPSDESSSGVLFSGGIDSLATLARHHEKSPMLLTIRGADIGLDQNNAWEQTKSFASEYASKYGLKNQFVQSNLYTFLDRPRLSGLFGYDITDGAWWSGVQHGIGLLSVCAPVAYKYGLTDLHIAASYTEDFNQPWGSHPAIDDRVAWTGTACHHDGFELSRQQKIELLVSHNEQRNFNLPFRVCYNSESGGNCSRCEKCCRTIVGLLVSGADPTNYGFTMFDDILEHIRTQIESGRWTFGFDEVYMWSDIQLRAPNPETVDDTEFASFYRWLRGIDLDDYRKASSQGLKQTVRNRLLDNLPYAYYDLFSLIYSKAK